MQGPVVAVVGLGRMGAAMARRLLHTGHRVRVYNRTPGPAEALRALGASVHATPVQAAAGAGAVLVMVAHDEASRAVWTGPHGILAAQPAPGALALECSTLSHGWVMELAAAAAAHGFRYLDCPVTGLPDAAAAGELTLLVGAEPAALAAAVPLTDALATRVLHLGPVGCGTAYKLIINLMGAVQIAAAAEGLALAERAGLDLDAVVRAIATSQAASPQVVRNTRRMADDDHDRDIVFPGVLRHKDTAYAMRFAASLGAAAPFGEVALRGLEALLAAGLGDRNESAVIQVARRPPA